MIKDLFIQKIHASSLTSVLEQELSEGSGLFASSDMESIVNSLVRIALPLAGFCAVVLLIVAGYQMITSQGNPDKLKEAKDMITNAIIGLVFILLSVSILVVISNVFNLGAAI